ncbi:lens fiber membrane intrinsic protein-like [Podarcis raffonei]|uniref:lens fiber membrane intrinsic protein-like n=1 Tax=Podarcis raffonei TaxID=65483 RepID=UPI00232944B2|nr:lens fiber membrane intrinsic protein-like [Podarcis raffonei]
MHILQISAVVSAFISLLLTLIALGSDHWVLIGNLNRGLWKFCRPSASSYICVTYSMDLEPDSYHATRAFLFFGMIAGAISCIGLCCTFFPFQLGSISKTKSSAIASLIAAGCVLIAMATFTGCLTPQSSSEWSYGWSFGLGWANIPLFLITGGLTFALDRAVSTGA